MDNHKVSVIIPLYNSSEFIIDTIQSILDQSYQDIEIIIIDDNSTDGSFELAQKFQSGHINVFKNKGKGACAARNYGFELSTGNYIQFLDADDLLSPNKLENQVKLLQEFPNRIAVCSTNHFYDTPESGKITDKDFMFSTDKPSAFLLNLYGANGMFEMVQTSAWLTPRALIDKAGLWDIKLSKDQDGEFFCRVVMASYGICYDPIAINHYRKHRDGMNIASKKQKQHIESQLKALESKERVLLQHDINEKDFKHAMALQYKFIAIEAWPEHKDLSNKAQQKTSVYGGSAYLPILGGSAIEIIKKILGWKSAKSFSNWIHNNKLISKLR
ncbi:glycosyltransferase family 2 protein [Formosa undariae]|uniref:Glycosyltransferase family 2 protein n=1 Tax=Formosa undariae TaxID=1325436 RepID=A0ABV5F521_9FLAO